MKKILLFLLLPLWLQAQSPFYNDVVRSNTLSPARVANALDANKAYTMAGTDTYTGSVFTAYAQYTTGDVFKLTFTNANTSGTITVNLNGLGAKAIKDGEGNNLAVGDLKAGATYQFIYNGTHFRMIGAAGGGGGNFWPLGGEGVLTDSVSIIGDGTQDISIGNYWSYIQGTGARSFSVMVDQWIDLFHDTGGNGYSELYLDSAYASLYTDQGRLYIQGRDLNIIADGDGSPGTGWINFSLGSGAEFRINGSPSGDPTNEFIRADGTFAVPGGGGGGSGITEVLGENGITVLVDSLVRLGGTLIDVFTNIKGNGSNTSVYFGTEFNTPTSAEYLNVFQVSTAGYVNLFADNAGNQSSVTIESSGITLLKDGGANGIDLQSDSWINFQTTGFYLNGTPSSSPSTEYIRADGTFGTPTAADVTTADNGLTETSNNIQWGGDLTEDETMIGGGAGDARVYFGEESTDPWDRLEVWTSNYVKLASSDGSNPSSIQVDNNAMTLTVGDGPVTLLNSNTYSTATDLVAMVRRSSTATGASDGVIATLAHTSTNTTANGFGGTLRFNLEDRGGTEYYAGGIVVNQFGGSAGAEDTRIGFNVATNGGISTVFTLMGDFGGGSSFHAASLDGHLGLAGAAGGLPTDATILNIGNPNSGFSAMRIGVQLSNAAVSSPVDTDIWNQINNDSGLKMRINGATRTFQFSDGLTSGRLPYATTNGLLTDEAALTYNAATNVLDVDDVTVNTEVYGSGWNGDLSVPTKDAVYDKIETLGGGGITNSAINLELMKSDGTNAIGSDIVIPSTANVNIGKGTTSGATRTMTATGSAANISLELRAQGTGSVKIYGDSATTTSGAWFSKPTAGGGAAGLQIFTAVDPAGGVIVPLDLRGTDDNDLMQVQFGSDTLSLHAGTGAVTGSSKPFLLAGAAAAGSKPASHIVIHGGDSGLTGDTSGDVYIRGGSNTHGSGVGGNVVFSPGESATNGYIIFQHLPTSSAGLPSGALWLNSNVLTIVP